LGGSLVLLLRGKKETQVRISGRKNHDSGEPPGERDSCWSRETGRNRTQTGRGVSAGKGPVDTGRKVTLAGPQIGKG